MCDSSLFFYSIRKEEKRMDIFSFQKFLQIKQRTKKN
jgi:hypothetical protein